MSGNNATRLAQKTRLCNSKMKVWWRPLDSRRLQYTPRKTLNDTELVYVAIAYNQGRVDISKDFKQGFKSKKDPKYYGEYIRDYMALCPRKHPRRPDRSAVCG